ncbi:MAG: hypothetical protein AAGF81_17290 [Pseudomonadota bacterium]
MSEELNDEVAKVELRNAEEMIEDVVGGSLSLAKEEQVLEDAEALLNRVLEYYRQTGNTHQLAVALENLAFLERHGRENTQRARKLFLEAAELFEQVGDRGEQIAALLELGEIDPQNSKTDETVREILKAGFAEDPHHTEDPMRLANAKWQAGDIDGSMSLYEDLLQEALNRNSKARAARLLRDVARIHEDGKNDRVRAAEALEYGLKLAEEANHKVEIGAALIRLTDIWVERQKPKVAQEYFERVLGMRGLPGWQKKLIGPMRMYFDGT